MGLASIGVRIAGVIGSENSVRAGVGLSILVGLASNDSRIAGGGLGENIAWAGGGLSILVGAIGNGARVVMSFGAKTVLGLAVACQSS